MALKRKIEETGRKLVQVEKQLEQAGWKEGEANNNNLEYEMACEAEEEDIPEEIPAKRRRSRTRIKRWSCLKCDNCLAEDCGQCINCLDRPKFGGPFIRKQRCVNKICLFKSAK